MLRLCLDFGSPHHLWGDVCSCAFAMPFLLRSSYHSLHKEQIFRWCDLLQCGSLCFRFDLLSRKLCKQTLSSVEACHLVSLCHLKSYSHFFSINDDTISSSVSRPSSDLILNGLGKDSSALELRREITIFTTISALSLLPSAPPRPPFPPDSSGLPHHRPYSTTSFKGHNNKYWKW